MPEEIMMDDFTDESAICVVATKSLPDPVRNMSRACSIGWLPTAVRSMQAVA